MEALKCLPTIFLTSSKKPTRAVIFAFVEKVRQVALMN